MCTYRMYNIMSLINLLTGLFECTYYPVNLFFLILLLFITLLLDKEPSRIQILSNVYHREHSF